MSDYTPLQAWYTVALLDGRITRTIESALRAGPGPLLVNGSYHHFNGFQKATIGRSLPGNRSLVARIWEPYTEDGEAHNHRWNFASAVLSGSITSAIYTEVEGSSHIRYIYRSPQGHDHFPMTRTQACSLNCIDRIRYYAGDCYGQDGREIHIASTGAEQTLTLVLQDTPFSETTRVYVQQDRQVEAHRQVRKLSRKEWYDALELVRDLTITWEP